jgi:predicted RNA-binding protein YlqC (UPF0109 family)
MASQQADPLADDELLLEIVRALVDCPEKVRIEETKGNESSMLLVHCAPEDRGKVIGKQGTTMNALRVIFGRIAAADGKKTYIQVANSGPEAGGRRTRTAA